MGFLDKAKQRAQEAQRKLDESGALDKAKQAAQQAQQKIDEKQRDFNKGQAGRAGGAGAPQTARYDEHGRPIPSEGPPAGTAPPPSAEPPPSPATPPTEPAASPGTPASGTPMPPPDVPTSGPGASGEDQEDEAPERSDVNRTPDPFKPIQ